MRVNTKLRYGLRAMLQIAEGYGGEPVPIRVIAESQEISGKYLEQVVGSLRRAGLITSRKGVRGGYSLSRPPQNITLWDVISALDSHDALVDCVVDPTSCHRSEICLTRTVWGLLSEKLREFWASYTLKDLHDRVTEAGTKTFVQIER